MNPTLKQVTEIPSNHRGRGDSKPDWNKVPEWAQMLIVTVCQDYGFEVPPVRWTTARARRGEKYSTGTTHWQDFTNEHTSVTIREGVYQHDAELVVLHELAHWTSPVWYHHTIKFWERAFDFYERYSPRLGFSMAYAVEREKGYKKGALKVIHERGYYAG